MDVDLEAALTHMATNPVARVEPPWRPDQYDWQEVLNHVRKAVPLSRACALAGLDSRRVRAWLRADSRGQQQLQEQRAAATAQLVGVVWQEATKGNNWKAALSLLRHTEPEFGPTPKRKAAAPATVQITAQTAQVLATADVAKLKQLVDVQ